MDFIVNTSPFAGREGKYVTSRNLRDRLFKEVETNVSMRVEPTSSTDAFKVSGRGELHLSILIETMRRQDFEFAVSRPKVIMKRDEQGHLLEPIEELTIDVPQEYMGTVMEKLGTRRAVLNNMINENEGSVRLIFDIPARGLMGYRSELLTDTRGNGVMSHIFKDYEPYTGEIAERTRGSLIASESGEANSYGLFNTQERGRLFVRPGDPIYEGQIVGECSRNEDIVVNVCKRKHVTNMRASGSDEALRLTPPVDLSLEQCMEFIRDDELVEVTPKNIRMRKRMNEFLKSLAEAVADKLWLAPVIAIVSGVLTSLMPCSLSTIPLVIGFVGGQDLPQNGKSSRRALLLSILFAVGSTVTFCILGMLASALGGLLERAETVLHFAMSILLVLMALQMWEVIRIIPSGNSVLAKSRLTGGIGAFISGIIAGLFASHCALPIVFALMAIAADAGGGNVLFGFMLLLLFSAGHAVLSVAAGTSVGFVQRLTSNAKYEKISRVIRIVLGIIIILVALYLAYEGLTECLAHNAA